MTPLMIGCSVVLMSLTSTMFALKMSSVIIVLAADSERGHGYGVLGY